MRRRSPIAFILAALAFAGGPGLPSVSIPRLALHAQEQAIELDTLEVQVGSRVTSRLPILSRSIQVLGRAEIGALPVRTVSGLLEWANGVEIISRSPAQSDLSIRGAGFEQTVVLVNGVRMSDPQTGHFDLDLTVPLDQVERVEILRGPASALYGADAVGGVVNVVTRTGGGPWRARAEAGSWGSTRASVGGAGGTEEGLSLQGGAELSRSDGHREGADFETVLLHLGLRRPFAGGSLSGEAGLSRRNFGAQGFYAPFPSFERTRTYTSSLRWASSRDGRATLETGASYRRHEDEFVLVRDDPGYYRNQHTSSQVGGEVLARLTPRAGVDVALGGDVFADILRSNSLGDRTEGRGAVFGELVLDRQGAGVASVGLREDWHEGFGTFFSPSLSGSYRFGGSLRLRTAVGRSFRAPSFTERYYQDPVNRGREDLAPERAWSGEVGADLLKGTDLQASFTVFVRRTQHLIDWARGSSAGVQEPWETRNVKEATFQGLEADVTMAGPMGTTMAVGGTLLSMRSEEIEGFRSKYALRPLLERLTGKIHRSFGRGFTMALQGQRSRRAGEAPYHRIDLRTSVRLGVTSLYLDAVNLTDQSHLDITGSPAPGRAFFLGLEVGFGEGGR
jgi:iron complex outermembrane receptor protein